MIIVATEREVKPGDILRPLRMTGENNEWIPDPPPLFVIRETTREEYIEVACKNAPPVAPHDFMHYYEVTTD